MDRMFVQFDKIMKPRIARLNEAAVRVADEIEDLAKKNSESGRGFGNDRYDKKYSTEYAKRRKSKGFQVEFVDLRRSQKRIETSRVTKREDGALIDYQSGGRILKYHHDGITYKDATNKMRSIFPKELKSIPKEVFILALKEGGKVLR
jgi:hypothetical protein